MAKGKNRASQPMRRNPLGPSASSPPTTADASNCSAFRLAVNDRLWPELNERRIVGINMSFKQPRHKALHVGVVVSRNSDAGHIRSGSLHGDTQSPRGAPEHRRISPKPRDPRFTQNMVELGVEYLIRCSSFHATAPMPSQSSGYRRPLTWRTLK